MKGLVALALVLVACGDFGEPSASPAAYEVVENEDSGAWAAGEEWGVREAWRIGGAEATERYVFSDRPLIVSPGPDGNIYVADLGAGELDLFSGEGAWIRQVAGEGGGPGELATPLALGWDSDERLWVVDFKNGRYSIFDLAGRLIDDFPRKVTRLPRLARRAVFDSTGALLDESRIETEGGHHAVILVRVRSGGEPIDTFPPLPPLEMGAYRPPTGPVPAVSASARIIRFAPQRVYAVTPTGIWFADSRALRMVHRTLEGDTTLVVETSHRSYELDPADRSWIEEQRRGMSAYMQEFPYSRQVVQRITPLEDGHLLVQIETEPAEDGRVFDVFDPEGIFLGSLTLPFRVDPESTVGVRADTIYVVGRDSLDAKFLARLTLDRGPS